jgi:hypothetical protein
MLDASSPSALVIHSEMCSGFRSSAHRRLSTGNLAKARYQDSTRCCSGAFCTAGHVKDGGTLCSWMDTFILCRMLRYRGGSEVLSTPPGLYKPSSASHQHGCDLLRRRCSSCWSCSQLYYWAPSAPADDEIAWRNCANVCDFNVLLPPRSDISRPAGSYVQIRLPMRRLDRPRSPPQSAGVFGSTCSPCRRWGLNPNTRAQHAMRRTNQQPRISHATHQRLLISQVR